MSNDLFTGLNTILPLKIRTAEWTDPTLVIAGDGWSIAISTPWRIASSNGLVLGSYEERAVDAVWDLSGLDVVDVFEQSTTVSLDPAFRLSDGSVLEVFTVDPVDPWVVSTPAGNWVG